MKLLQVYEQHENVILWIPYNNTYLAKYLPKHTYYSRHPKLSAADLRHHSWDVWEAKGEVYAASHDFLKSMPQ